MNRSQALVQAATVAGYFLPQVRVGERVQLAPGGLLGGRGVDRAQRGRDGLAVAVGHEPHRGPDQVHDTGLDDRLGPGRGDRLGEAGQPVAADDQHVLDAAVGQLGADPGPELRALGGLHPDPQDVLDPVQVDPDGDVRGAVAHVRPVADLDHERVEVQHRVERLQRARLPGGDLLGDGLGDLADRLVGQLGARAWPRGGAGCRGSSSRPRTG